MRLAVDSLLFSYGRDQPPVITNLTYEFAPAALTVVNGPSGGGKSTLLYLLALMLQPTAGVVSIDARAASVHNDTTRSRIRAKSVGFVFQDAVLDPSRTVLDNVLEGTLYAGVTRAQATPLAREILDRFGVGHRADHRPGEISGGQAQRVALCRALIKRPPVMLADEPTGNLDPDSARVVWGALEKHAAGGATVIVATHDPRLSARASHRLVI